MLFALLHRCYSGHSIHFQVRGDHSKVEGGILPNQYAKQNFHFDIFIFENKVDGQKLQLDEQFA